MGIITDKSHVMVQPTILVMRKAPEGKSTVPATIQDKLNVGWLVKYFLIFDDNQVCISKQDALQLLSVIAQSILRLCEATHACHA